jgi:Peptidase family M28
MLDQHKPLLPYKLAQALILLIGVLTLASIGLYHTVPAKPSSVAVSATVFSAARAMIDVRQIGSHPHPTGSLENAKVRQYLIAKLKELGLKPEIQSTLVVNPEKKLIGKIHNVLVRVAGSKPSKALMLAAHYDSVHTGPGAADDGASVAAILETLRAIKTQPPLQNDLICLFSDSEENGLLGAEGFIRQHPWAKDVGLALNFEYRGNQGAFMMFETSLGNAKLVQGLATAAPSVLANSLMYEVYKRLPNDTDLSIFKQAGIPGMNFAAIEGFTSYHTQLDSPERLDQGSLQHEGDVMLALVKHFGNSPLTDLAASDRIYFDFPGLGLINYPVNLVMPLNGFLLLLFVIVIRTALSAKSMRISRIIAGAFIFLLILIGIAVSMHFAWSVIRQMHPEYDTFLQGDTYNSHWYLLAFVVLGIGLFRFFQAYVSKVLRPMEFSFGILSCWLLFLLLSSVWLPGASFLFFWPLAAMLMVVGLSLLRTEKSVLPSYAMLIFLGSIPAILIFTPIIKALFIGLTPQMIGVVVVFLVLLLGLLTPILEAIGYQKWVVLSALFLGLSALVGGAMTSGFDAEHPRQNTLFYVLNSSEQRGFWLSTDKQLDQWTSLFFGKAPEKHQMPALLGDSPAKMWIAPASTITLPSPDIEKLEDISMSGKRKLRIRIKSLRLATKLKVSIEGASVNVSKVAGQLFSASWQSHWEIDSVGLIDEDLTIELMVNARAPLRIKAVDFSYGLPDLIPSPRPAYMMSKPTEFSDTTAVVNVKEY